MQLLPGVGGGDGSGPGLWSVRAAITDPTDGRRKLDIYSLETLETGSARSGCRHGRLLLPRERDSAPGLPLGLQVASACSHGLLPMELVRGPCSHLVASVKARLLFRPRSEVLDKVQHLSWGLSRELSLACNPGPPRSVSWGPCSRGPGQCPQCGVMRAWCGRGCPPRPAWRVGARGP